MYEVEVKVKASHDAVRETLESTDATFRRSVEQTDRYFNAPHRDFAASDEALRIRTVKGEGDSVTKVTYKGPRLDGETKTRTEHETEIGDAEAMTATLEALGFEPVATVEKHREYYELGTTTVTLDSVSGLGEFVEVEIVAETEALDASQQAVTDTLAELGLEDAETVSESYLELLLAGAEGSE